MKNVSGIVLNDEYGPGFPSNSSDGIDNLGNIRRGEYGV